jgi:hypothetical protein
VGFGSYYQKLCLIAKILQIVNLNLSTGFFYVISVTPAVEDKDLKIAQDNNKRFLCILEPNRIVYRIKEWMRMNNQLNVKLQLLQIDGFLIVLSKAIECR